MKKDVPFYLLCAVGGLAIFSSTIAKNPVLPILAQGIGAGKATIGLIAAASTVTGILASLPAGLLSDRRGRRPVLLGSGLVFFTAPLLYFFVHVPWQLAAVRVYHGLATAVFGPVAMAYVADLAPAQRGEKLGYYSSATLVGRALAPVVGGAVLALGAWQGVYAVGAAAALLALAGMALLPEPEPAAPGAALAGGSGQRPTLRAVLGDRNILLIGLAEAAQFLTYGALETFLPLYALSVGINEAAVGLLFGVQVGVRTLARPLWGALSDRYGRKWPIVIGLAVTALATALFTQTRSWLALLAISAGFGLGLSIATAATSAFVADLAPREGRGAALGLMSTIMDVGQATGPVLLGAILVGATYQAGFAVIGGLVLVAMGLFAVGARGARTVGMGA